jgi:hypothetical protein
MIPFQKQSSRGATLPVVMFGTAILLGWVRLLTLETTATGTSLSTRFQGEETRAQSRERLAHNIPLTRLCEELSVSLPSVETSYIRCSQGMVPFMTQPPFPLPPMRVDYDEIFSRAETCAATTTNISPGASGTPKALTTCALPSMITGGATVLDNLKGDAITLVTRNGEVSLLATPGSVTITNTLSIAHDLLIVSGGDIDIGAINNTSNVLHRVTIISSLGAITVGQAIGPLSLLAAGRSAIQVPQTVVSTSYPLPPMRTPSLRGFASRSSISPFS